MDVQYYHEVRIPRFHNARLFPPTLTTSAT